MVFPHAKEAAGRNAIPAAMAEHLEREGLQVDETIVQTNRPKRTDRDGALRLVLRPNFDGDIEAGRSYVLVDDAAGQGGTFSELREYIESHGGTVVHSMVMAHGRASTVLPIQSKTVDSLIKRFGRNELEQFLREANTAGRIENPYRKKKVSFIGRQRSLDEIRDRIIEEAQEERINLAAWDIQGELLTRWQEATQDKGPAYSRRRRSGPPENATSSLFPEVQARIEANRGIKAKRWLEKVREGLVKARHSVTRHFIHLDPKKFGNVVSILREAEAIPHTSQEWAAERMRDILGGMTKDEYHVFSMRLILPDMLKDIESGLLDEDDLPFGYQTRYQVERDLRHFEINSSELVNERLQARERIMEELRKDLLAHKILSKDTLDDPRYFHHQVMQYMAADSHSGTGSKDARVRWKGWKSSRKGSALDYNTDYLQAEFAVMSQGRADVLRSDVLKEIRQVLDKSKQLKRAAKSKNLQRFYAVAGVMPDEIGTKADPLRPFAGKMAMFFSQLEKMAADDKLVAPPDFEDVLGELKEIAVLKPEMQEAGLSADEMHVQSPKLFAYLGWLAQGNHPGSAKARGIFKTIAQREKLIKSTLGKQFQTLKDLVPDGHTIWLAHGEVAHVQGAHHPGKDHATADARGTDRDRPRRRKGDVGTRAEGIVGAATRGGGTAGRTCTGGRDLFCWAG